MLIALGVMAINRSRPYGRFIAFGIFWFYLTLSVESSLIPIAHVINEHRLYLPSVGLFISFVSVVFFIASRCKQVFRRRALISATAIFIVYSCIFSVATYTRNGIWNDEESIYADGVIKSPNLWRSHYGLGLYYKRTGNYDSAAHYLNSTIERVPHHIPVYWDLASVCRQAGDLNGEIEAYQRALSHSDDLFQVNPASRQIEPFLHRNLGVALYENGNVTEALRVLETATALNPATRDAQVDVILSAGEKQP
jgi:tetratricopeptide (TPR) repeat protein